MATAATTTPAMTPWDQPLFESLEDFEVDDGLPLDVPLGDDDTALERRSAGVFNSKQGCQNRTTRLCALTTAADSPPVT